MERLRLRVSPKGQITLPKRLRQTLFTGDYVYLSVHEDKAVLEPVSFLDEFDDLIVKEVEKEGYKGQEVAVKVKEKKRVLLKALEEELRQDVEEAERDWEKGRNVVLWPRKE